MRNRNVIIVIIAAVLAVLLFGGMGMMSFGQNGMMGRFGAMGFGYSPLGMVMPMLLWILMLGGGALLVAWLVQRGGPSQSASTAGESPLHILKLRFAKGEITKEQFDEMKVHLGA